MQKVRGEIKEAIDGSLIYDELYERKQLAVSGLDVYLCHIVCIFTMFLCVCVCVCVCTGFHTWFLSL